MTSFIIPGKPHAKQRPRFRKATGHSYTPKETVSFEDTVRAVGLEHFKEPLEGPVKLTVIASFVPPKSWSKKKTMAHMFEPHRQKPDWDNLGKSISDGLNRVAYADDSQVAECYILKKWSDVEQTFVRVEAIR